MRAPNRFCVLHLITGLKDGGAEGVLARLVLNSETSEHVVISLKGEGKYGQLLKKNGVTLYFLNLGTLFDLIPQFLRLVRIVKAHDPDLIQSWLYHADFLTSVLKLLNRKVPVIWNVRTSRMNWSRGNRLLKILVHVNSLLSHIVPARVVFNSFDASDYHIGMGYNRKKSVIIPNGFVFPREEGVSKLNLTSMLLKSDAVPQRIRFGMLARYHEQKGFSVMLAAAKLAEQTGLDFHLFLGGENVSEENPLLLWSIKNIGLKKVTLMGQFHDPSNFYNQIDCLILPSIYGESFPNVIGEAMLRGKPCISSDVGDAKKIIGDIGWVVQRNCPHSILRAMESAVFNFSDEKAWYKKSVKCRISIQKNYSMESMLTQFDNLWKQVLKISM